MYILRLLEVMQNIERKYFCYYGIHKAQIYTKFAVIHYAYMYTKFGVNRKKITILRGDTKFGRKVIPFLCDPHIVNIYRSIYRIHFKYNYLYQVY